MYKQRLNLKNVNLEDVEGKRSVLNRLVSTTLGMSIIGTLFTLAVLVYAVIRW